MKQSIYYHSLNHYLKEQFHEKVYRLALDGGMSCPNRDGLIGHGGCIFCSGGGSGEFAEKAAPQEDASLQEFCYHFHNRSMTFHPGQVNRQIEQAKERIRKKTDAGKFIAYFQSYTNTYGPVEYLEKLFTEAISHPDVVILSIGTRPDCLQEEVVDLLARLNRIKPVWVELGLQTIHEKTASYIRRGYPLSVYEDAVKRLHEAGIEVITHLILGLPGESKEDMLASCAYLGQDPALQPEGVKLQLLHVLRGTDLARDYEDGNFQVLSLEEYIDILSDCVKVLPQDIIIHRLTGDGDKKLLIAPLWSGDKKRVLNTVNQRLKPC